MSAKDPGRSLSSTGPGEPGQLVHLLSLQTAIAGLLDAHLPLGDAVNGIVSALKGMTCCDAVGLRLAEGDDYPFAASVGYSDDFLETENVLTVSYPDGGLCRNDDGSVDLECTCGLVLQGKIDFSVPLLTPGGSVWTNDSLELLDLSADDDPRLHPRNLCIHAGFRSIALVPLRAGEEILGLLHLADRRIDHFTSGMIQFYEGIGATIGMALRSRRAERDLRESGSRLRLTIDEAPVGIVTVGLDLRFLSANRAFCDFAGLSEQQLTLKTISDITHPDDLEIGMAEIRSILHGETKSARVEKRYMRPDGSVVWGQIDIGLVYGDEGNPGYLLAIIQDVTARKRAEAALRQSEEKFRSVFATAPDAMYVASLVEGRLVEVNSAFEQLFALAPGEAAGKTTVELGIFSDRDERRRWMAVIESEGLIKDLEFSLSGRGGELVEISYSARMLTLEGEKFVLAALRDVTPRNKGRRRLERLQRLLDQTQQMGKVGGWEFDIDSGLQTWTEEVYRIHEVDAAFVPTVENGVAFYAPASRPVIEQAARRAVELGEPFDVELEIVTAKGNLRNVRAIGRADLARRRVYGFFQDITERVEAEKEHLRLERQVQRGRSLESLAVLAGGVAHDFNNLLMTILGNAELTLAELPPSAPGSENLREIIEASHRTAALAEEMLTYSGTGLGAHELVDVAGLIRGVLDDLRSSISGRAQLETDFGPDLPVISGDPSRLRQILVNLVTNASEALGNEGGVITVSARGREASADYLRGLFPDQSLPAGAYLVISVADTGSGMDAETQAQAFEPFFTTKFVGRGLGLSAVLGIVRAHQGAITVDSTPGEGTSFTVLMPAAPHQGIPADAPS